MLEFSLVCCRPLWITNRYYSVVVTRVTVLGDAITTRCRLLTNSHFSLFLNDKKIYYGNPGNLR